jgi:hypothetical protein
MQVCAGLDVLAVLVARRAQEVPCAVVRAERIETMALTCKMVRVTPGLDGCGHEEPPCGKPRRRRTCCDDCFEVLVASGEFTRAEAERDYPLVYEMGATEDE